MLLMILLGSHSSNINQYNHEVSSYVIFKFEDVFQDESFSSFSNSYKNKLIFT